MASADVNKPLWVGSGWSPRPVDLHDSRADLAVVGGGILGLTTALFAQRLGRSVLVLEAGAIGGAAAGLNGGQVIPGLKHDPDWLAEHLGTARAEKLAAFVSRTADVVFDLIAGERLEVPHLRRGWIYAAHTAMALRRSEARHRQWKARGADVELLDAAAVGRLTGAAGYFGGWLDRRAGVIDPLAYTTELARVAELAGARIAQGARVLSLHPSGGLWELALANAKVRANKVLVAANAYADRLVPGLAASLIPLHSFQIATAPLPPSLAQHILPEGHAVSDSRRIVVYYRKSPDGRLMLGGRGRMRPPAAPEHWAHLERAMRRLFPVLEGVPIERRWFGKVAMTLDQLPHLHEPEPGLVAFAGCQGRGIGLMTAMGERLAAYLVSGDGGELPFPVTAIQPIPFHAFRQLGVAAAITWYRLLDALER